MTLDWILLIIVVAKGISAKHCCPPGQKLHPRLGCPSDPAPLWRAEPTQVFNTTGDTGSFEVAGDPCEQQLQLNGNVLQKTWGLPVCQLHSLVVICDALASENDTLIRLTDSSSLCVNGHCQSGEKELHREFPVEDSCWEDSADNPRQTAVVCPCLGYSCIRKCCPSGEILDESLEACVQNNSVPDWKPTFHGKTNDTDYFLVTNSFPPECEQPHFLKIPYNFNQFPRCFSDDDLKTRNHFVFNTDGSVKIEKYNFAFGQEAYCGDHTLHKDGTLILNNLLICLPKEVTERPAKFDVYGVLLIIGGCFLVLTVIISCYLPELRGTLYHKVTICHNVALMIASFTWGTANLLPSISYPLCVTFSLIIQFTFLSSFFWMNVMCIDIALAFKHLRSLYGPTGDKKWGRFFWYSAYAWGCPLLLTAFTAAMELSPSVPAFMLRPGFGCKNCGFNSESYAILIYFYGPIIFVLLFNLSLFILTILRIRQVEKQTAILKSKGNLHKSLNCCPDTQRLMLFGKMFILMGLTWGTEVIGWWIGGPAVFWYLPDLINFLRAVFLFVVFIGKRTVWTSLWQKVTRQRNSLGSQTRRSKSSSMERRDAEIERRGRILAKQITQTFRMSGPEGETVEPR